MAKSKVKTPKSAKKKRPRSDSIEKPTKNVKTTKKDKMQSKKNDKTSSKSSKKRKQDDKKTQSAKKIRSEIVRKPGDIVNGRLEPSKSFAPPSLAIKLGHNEYGRVCITHTEDSDSWVDQPQSKFKPGQFVQCVVLHPRGSSEKKVATELSIRPSLLAASGKPKKMKSLVDEDLKEADKLPEKGQLVKGFVATTSKAGCFVRLSRNVTARVILKNLSDKYVENVAKEFPTGKLVAGRVIAVDEDKKQVDVSLKSSAVVGESSQKWTWETIAMGARISGRVRKVEKYGVFIDLDDSARLSGLCHVSEACDKFVKDIAQEYSPGDRVKVVVIKVDKEKKRLSLGMKPSYFEENDSDDEMEVEDASEEEEKEKDSDTGKDVQHEDSTSGEEESDDEEEDDDESKLKVLESVSDSEVDEDETIEKIVNYESEEDDEEDEDSSDVDSDDDEAPTLQQALKKLQKHDSDSEEEEEEEEEEETSKSHHKSSREREKMRKRTEAETRDREEARLEDDVPQSAEDFERLLLTSPNSSFLWINYMAFRIQETDIDRARAVAERALRSINFREETEKLNVWVALLNLEHKYGDEKSFDAVFKRMVQHNEPKIAYLKLAELHAKADEIKKAESAYRKCIKKTKGESKVAFLEFIRFKFDIEDAAGARDVLKDALKRLPMDKYVDTVVKFARIEFSHESGDGERARTLLEGLIDNYSKRTDVWHQYIDMEVKYGSLEKARRLHERVTTLKVSTKKMKTFFKKWLDFEGKHGDEERVEYVKSKAREFVESVNA